MAIETEERRKSVSIVTRRKMEEVKRWVEHNAPQCRTEQKHLDNGTAERAYWHHGYLSALQDVLKFISSSEN
jgi:hypothetical protein